MTARFAVIGGGIAGSAACLALARAGEAPVWLAPPEDRTGPKPGEHLSPAARPLLEGLGAADLLDHPSHRAGHLVCSAWSSRALAERHGIQHPLGPPLVIDRRRFEADLAERAIEAGAEHRPAALREIRAEAGIWQIETDASPLEAECVIDATGRSARLAGRLGQRFQADRLVASALVLQAQTALRPVTVIEASAAGWWYLTVLADGAAMLMFFSDADLMPGPLARDASALLAAAAETDHIGAFLAENDCRPAAARPVLSPAGTAWIAPACGPGWLAIGDAGAAFDPLSSHGMTTALWSAVTAARALVARDRQGVARYAADLARGVKTFLSERRAIYAQVHRFSTKPFWQRRTNMRTETAEPEMAASP
ncbi:MAG: tryptophan 7-halogenase [Pseudomonadota bacterium]